MLKIPGTCFSFLEHNPRRSSLWQKRKNAIIKRGGTIKPLSQETDVVVLGSETAHLSKKAQRALQWGIPMISIADLIKLMEQGVLDLTTEHFLASGSRSFEQSLGELRGQLDLESRDPNWERICACVDLCQPDQLEPLIHYIEGHVNQWSSDDQRKCRAPYDWMKQLASGMTSPKFKLIRALELFETSPKPHPLLQNLGQLSPGQLKSVILNGSPQWHFPVEFIHSMHRSPACKELEEIGFRTLGAPQAKALAQGKGLKQLTSFYWCETSFDSRSFRGAWNYRDGVQALMKMPCLQDITTLKLNRLSFGAMFFKKTGAHLSNFKHLKVLDLTAQTNVILSRKVSTMISEQHLSTLKLAFHPFPFVDVSYKAPHEIPNVSHLVVEFHPPPIKHIERATRHGEGSFLPHIEALKLTPHTAQLTIRANDLDNEEADLLSSLYPHIELNVEPLVSRR